MNAVDASSGGPPDLFQLRKWASMRRPETLPPTVLLDATERTIAIMDKYPKAMFHALVLPRPRDGVSAEDMDNLRTLVAKVGKERAKEVLEDVGAHARRIRDDIQLEMKRRYKFQWDVWIGFHAVPSMHHLHLHVISSDLHREKMKNKKHYNSFHPKHGFFLHYDDVMSWFDAVPSFFQDKISLRPSQYEPILKYDLSCFQCDQSFKNMPTLKAHLENHHTTKWNAAIKTHTREKLLKKGPETPKPAPKVIKKRKPEPGKPNSVASASSRTSAGTSGTCNSTDDTSHGREAKKRRTSSPHSVS